MDIYWSLICRDTYIIDTHVNTHTHRGTIGLFVFVLRLRSYTLGYSVPSDYVECYWFTYLYDLQSMLRILWGWCSNMYTFCNSLVLANGYLMRYADTVIIWLLYTLNKCLDVVNCSHVHLVEPAYAGSLDSNGCWLNNSCFAYAEGICN